MSARTAITIGNFDGVHRGHAALVRAARAAAGRSGRVIVLAFEPHPATVLRTTTRPARLSSFAQRVSWLRQAGADEILPLSPSINLLSKSPEEFIDWLAKEHRPDVIVEGSDFRFGRARSGSIQTLREISPRHGIDVVVIDDVAAVLANGTQVRVSSTLTRWLVEQGRVSDAAALLGRRYEIAGSVVRGDQRGRTLGFPTANLGPTDQLLPADGIYSGEAQLPDGRTVPAAISVGTKPTFGKFPRVCETHLVGYTGGLDEYGWTIIVCFGHWIREQMEFPTSRTLVQQIGRDVTKAAQAWVGADRKQQLSNGACLTATRSEVGA